MSQVVLSDAEVVAWERDGYLIKEHLVEPSLLEELREAYEQTLADTSPGDRMLGGITRQIMNPAQVHPVFADNALLDLGRAIVCDLFDAVAASRVFDMLIFKPAGHPHETPWHQDLSYARMPFAPAGTPPSPGTVQFWVALDDVDEDNGCMQFVPGHHQEPLLPHLVAAGDDGDVGRLLAIDTPEEHLDLSTRVVAAFAAGGVTMHSHTTPHYTGPNTTDRPRRAYIFNIAAVEADVETRTRRPDSSSHALGLAGERPRYARTA